MADSHPTTGDLYKAKAILEADVVAAVNALMADPTTTAFPLGDGYRLDLAEAVSRHEWAKVTVANKDTAEHPRRANRDLAGPAGENMTQQAPTPDEILAAAAFLKKRGRNVDPIPGDKAGLYRIDGHISTGHDVVRHAVMAGWKVASDQGSEPAKSGKKL